MSTVLIIGAGGVGNVVAHKCAQNTPVFSRIVLASRTLSKCEGVRDAIGGNKIETAQVNADNVSELVPLIHKVKPNLVINVALPYQNLSIMDACLETGVHYLDTANYEPPDTAKFEYSWQWAYHARFQERGITALLGSGFDPGVTNVFCAFAARRRFDEISMIDILDANAGEHGYPFATNFNPEINIRELTARGRFWENGSWIETEPLGVRRTFAFPEIGPRDIYLLYHEELESLVKNIRGLKRIRFFMTFSENFLTHLRVLVNTGMTGIHPVIYEGREIVPLRFLKTLLPDPATLGARTQGKTNIGCIFEGIKDGKKKRLYLYNVCDHQACYREVKSQAISYTTGVPAMVGAMMILTGTWEAPGVYNLEEFDPVPFLNALPRWGLNWNEKELGADELVTP